jgi:hypothetical protein
LCGFLLMVIHIMAGLDIWKSPFLSGLLVDVGCWPKHLIWPLHVCWAS